MIRYSKYYRFQRGFPETPETPPRYAPGHPRLEVHNCVFFLFTMKKGGLGHHPMHVSVILIALNGMVLLSLSAHSQRQMFLLRQLAKIQNSTVSWLLIGALFWIDLISITTKSSFNCIHHLRHGVTFVYILLRV